MIIWMAVLAPAKPDPRLNAWRDDLAAAHLRGEVAAPAYADATLMQVAAPVTALRRSPADGAMQDSQLLFGEMVDVYEIRNGWAWGQARHDDYIGYMLAEDLAPPLEPTHKLTALRSFIYRDADIKSRPLCGISFGAQVSVAAREGHFVALESGGYLYAAHAAPVDVFETQALDMARRFIGAPYFWGGREATGLDCSALVQLALSACGQACPRDSDMQWATLGQTVETPKAGDLVFWKGHVGFMSYGGKVLHANAHHMAVVEEDFAAARARIAAAYGDILGFKRLA